MAAKTMGRTSRTVSRCACRSDNPKVRRTDTVLARSAAPMTSDRTTAISA
nr:hypothetical protein [Nonomuraea spiralis]